MSENMPYSKVHIMEKERDPLNLRSLPLVSPPEDDWPVIEAALLGHKRRKRAGVYLAGALAVAATVTLAVGLFLNGALSGPGNAIQNTLPTVAQQDAALSPPPDLLATSDTEAPPLESLIALSQQLETRIREIRSEVGGMPTDSLIYQVELEDLVAQVDDELSKTPDSQFLWSQRVSLLLDLNQLYEKQLRRDYHRMASL